MSGSTLVLYSETSIATYCVDIKEENNAKNVRDEIDVEAENLGIVELD